MLRYFRRPVTARILWVDAICIHQLDAAEKAAQIPKMTSIYRESMRVLVYLEEATGRPAGKHAARRDLHLADSGVLEQMTKCRYFTRLWVVQELILPHEVLFPFGGSSIAWGSTPAPWLHYLTQGSIASDDGVIGALSLTAPAESADIRDKLFGILGLIEGDNFHGLRPDYSISELGVFIGLFSHCAVNTARLEMLLLDAGGIRSWGKCPSWVPDRGTGCTFPRAPLSEQWRQSVYLDEVISGLIQWRCYRQVPIQAPGSGSCGLW